MLPVFVKAGSIIPMGNYAVSTAFLSAESLTIHLYPGSDASFQLIEDDGISEFHRTKNEKRITNISYKQSTATLTINASTREHMPEPRTAGYSVWMCTAWIRTSVRL
jgi:alpha-D-xyloside xylohydrolase